jgi:hypothetical protein
MPKTYTSDREWIKELLSYEHTSGTASGGSHPNYGYNSKRNAPTFKNLEEAVDYFIENDLPFIKEQYPGNIMERAKAGDYIFNTGKDPKLYAVNQYLNDNKGNIDQADLDYLNEKDPKTGNSKRVRIKNAMIDGVVGFKYGDSADRVKINELYDKYVRKIPDKERIANLDDARNFYYQNTNVGSGAWEGTWYGRTNLYGGYTGKHTEGRNTINQETKNDPAQEGVVAEDTTENITENPAQNPAQNVVVEQEEDVVDVPENEPPKPKYVIGEDENGKYVETLVDRGQPKIDFDPNKRNSSSQPGERYIKEYVKNAEILSTRTIGNNEYIVKAYTDDEGVLQNEYLSLTEKGAGKNKLKKENKQDLYKREITDIMQGGLTKENVEKARDVYDTAIEDYRRSGDSELPDKDQQSYKVGNHFYQSAAAPFLEQEVKEVKQKQQERLLDLQNQHANAFGEEKEKIAEQIKEAEKNYSDIVKRGKDISQTIQSIKKGEAPSFWQGTPVVMGDFGQRGLRTQKNQFDWYQDLFKDDVKKYRESGAYKNYYDNLKALEKEKEKQNRQSSSSRTESRTSTTYTQGTSTSQVEPDDRESTEEKVELGQGEYLDREALEDTLADIKKQLDDTETVEEFTPDLSMLDQQNTNRYTNLISMAGDLGAGIMGLKGAMEEIPVYEKGKMFQEYTDEAYRQRNMGLSPEEMGLRKQLAERGFGYDVKNIRRLAGGSAGVALGNLGRAAGTLQTRYGQIAAEDSAVRRMNQQRFDRAAGADETFNRRKFEDSFKVAMLNKEMGAQLVRDKMKNMHERQMFEKQYGKGSMYDALSREMLISKQANTHALKMAQEYQMEKRKDYLTKRQRETQTKLNKLKEKEEKTNNQ